MPADPHPAHANLHFPEHVLGAHRARWLATVDEAYAEMERRIDAATTSVRLETYLLREAGPAHWLANALLRARARGVRVRLLIDAFGSEDLRPGYLQPLRAAGVQVALFNPKRLLRLSFRNHRKLLACDGAHAVVGGFNIGPEYAGDGVQHGWCDTGLCIAGPIVHQLEQSFDAMYNLAPFSARSIRRFRHVMRRRLQHRAGAAAEPVRLLLSGPALPFGLLRRALRHDLGQARQIAIASAYFLPSQRLRRLLYRAARPGGRVRVLLAGHSDVPIARLAAEVLYDRLLRRGVQILEYQPQVLHAKVVILDDVVHVGSCNLDRRSLHINYELLLRLHWPALAADARQWFDHALTHSRAVDAALLRQRRGFWRRALSRIAYLLLARIDPLLARRRFRAIS
jgi:cardiolipin synthase A/B